MHLAITGYVVPQTLHIRTLYPILTSIGISQQMKLGDAWRYRKERWIKLSDADADFKIAASPLPDTSTNSSLIPTWTEVHYLELQTTQLKADADWLDANWKK